MAVALLSTGPLPAAAAPKPPEVGDVLGGTYRLDRVLGAGAMGIVYAATELRSHEQHAIKWMRASPRDDSDGALRLMREYLVSTRVEHESVIDVERVGRHAGRFFLVMELLDGEPLSAVIARGAIPPQRAVALLMPALEGVAAAHAHGVVHRDLKPDNIFVLHVGPDEPPRAKVLDFGLCKLAAEDDEVDLKLTQQVKALGTPLYMSPEQIRDPASVDRRTDVYSLGVVLYQMLTQKLPFNGKGYNDLIIRVATETPPTPQELVPDLDPKLSEAVMKAMAREPAARFADVPAFMDALRPFRDGRPPDPVPQPVAVASEHPAAFGAAGVVPDWAFDLVAILGALAFGVALYRRKGGGTPRA